MLSPKYPGAGGVVLVVPFVVAGDDEDGRFALLKDVGHLNIGGFGSGIEGAGEQVAEVDQEFAFAVAADFVDIRGQELVFAGFVRAAAGGGKDERLGGGGQRPGEKRPRAIGEKRVMERCPLQFANI